MFFISYLKEKLSFKRNVKNASNYLYFRIIARSLTEKSLETKEMGVTNESLCDREIIVSLTTYGKRLYEVFLTIESIMQGTMRPNRIILWLENDLREIELPITLQRQSKRGLEIRYCKNIRSYKKLIPTLKQYPEACIITIDDDLIYNCDLVENLVRAYKQNSNYIYANRIHRIKLGKNSRPISYMNWEWCSNNYEASNLNFLTSGGGTLFPPRSLSQEVFNESVFMDICKYADDIWINAMALMKGTKIKKCYTHNPKGEDFILNEDLQDISLRNINNNKKYNMNDIQFTAVFEKYKLFTKLK